MEQFVDNHAGQFDAIELEQVRQQRIIEEAEAGKGDGRPDMSIEAVRFEVGGLGLGAGAIEVAAIRHRADNRKPPGVGSERGPRRGHHDYTIAPESMGDGA